MEDMLIEDLECRIPFLLKINTFPAWKNGRHVGTLLGSKLEFTKFEQGQL